MDWPALILTGVGTLLTTAGAAFKLHLMARNADAKRFDDLLRDRDARFDELLRAKDGAIDRHIDARINEALQNKRDTYQIADKALTTLGLHSQTMDQFLRTKEVVSRGTRRT